MKHYDALIFDVDGTLWDARESITQSWNKTVDELTGTPGTLDAVSFGAQFGKAMNELYAFAFPEMGEEERTRLGECCVEQQNVYLMHHPGKVYPGVAETLEALSRHYPLYIVSNCGAGYIEALLEGTGLGRYFQGWLCYADTHAPKGVTIRTLMNRYGLSDSVYVGDIQGDAEACKQAGIDIIFAAYGLGSIKDGDYAAKINTFSDLLEVLQ